MALSCQVAGCKRDAVMTWRFTSEPMSPADVRVCETHVREALSGRGRLYRAILAVLDVAYPRGDLLPDNDGEAKRPPIQADDTEGG